MVSMREERSRGGRRRRRVGFNLGFREGVGRRVCKTGKYSGVCYVGEFMMGVLCWMSRYSTAGFSEACLLAWIAVKRS